MTNVSSRRVLLIEDEPNIAEALVFILARDGWEVTHIATGSGAAGVVARLEPALVILDHMLPGQSGLDILHDIRRDPKTAEVPVMMLTAKGLPRDREIAEKAGVTCFMTKPFSNATILAEVRALAGGAGV